MESASLANASSKSFSAELGRTRSQERERLGRSWRARYIAMEFEHLVGLFPDVLVSELLV